MKRVLSVLVIVLISTGFSYAQDENYYTYQYWGLDNIIRTDVSLTEERIYDTFSSSLNPYFNFNSSGYGARSMAMGGVYYAMANDAYGSFLNPAGMIFTNKSVMSIDLFADMDKHEAPFFLTTPSFTDPDTGLAYTYNQSEIDAQHNRFDQAGAVAPFTYFDREWWIGGGFRTVYDLHTDLTIPSYFEDQRALFTQHRGIDAINMAIATNPMPNIGVGINFNIYTRGFEQDIWVPINYIDPENGDTVGITAHIKDKSTFTGTNFDIGAIADFDMFKAALVISTPLTLTQKSVLTAESNQSPDRVYRGFIDRITAQNKFPMYFGGGFSFAPLENFSLGADVTYKPYSKTLINLDPEQTIYDNVTDYDPEWNDLTQFRFGAEYVYDAGFARIPLRAGMQNIPSLKNNYTRYLGVDTASVDSMLYEIDYDSTVVGDQFNTYLFSIGTGITFDKIWFDIAYQFGSSEYDHSLNFYRLDELYYTWNDPIKFNYSRLYVSMGMLF